MKVLVAGCGSMGLPMAQALNEQGIDTVGFDTTLTELHTESGVNMLDSPIACGADVMIVVVRDIQQIFQLCFVDQAVYASEHYPKYCIVSSTISVQAFRSIREKLPKDTSLIDAPMSGAPVAARERRLTFMLGGLDSDKKHIKPLLGIMGKKIVDCGDSGAGMRVKTLNNTVAASSVVAVRRALFQAERYGLDAELLLSTMKASSGSTWYGDNYDSIDWSDESFEKQNTIGILHKDVSSALEDLDREPDDYEQALLSSLTFLPKAPKT